MLGSLGLGASGSVIIYMQNEKPLACEIYQQKMRFREKKNWGWFDLRVLTRV